MTTIRQAVSESDLGEALEILDDAARWLLDREIMQWPFPYPRKPVEEAFTDGNLWLVTKDGEIVATFRTARHDKVWDGDARPALYIHALAGKPGRNTSRTVIAWAVAHAKANDLHAVRLDCWSGNEKLKALYRSLGFTYVDDVAESDETRSWFSSRFELQI